MKNNLKLREQTIANDEKINQLTQANQEYKKTKKVKKKEQPLEIESYEHFLNIACNMVSNNKPPKNSLSELVFHEKIEELEKKLKLGIIPDGRDEHGLTASWTPLYWSVKYRKIECVKLLLSYGANINLVVNDLEECCGTVLDLATLRCDDEMEFILREFAEKEEVNLGVTFKAIRTKLRGKAPAFHFNSYGKKRTD
jgi:ankyrin repeat protein